MLNAHVEAEALLTVDPSVSLPTTLVWSVQKVLVPEEPGPTGVATTVNDGFGAAGVGPVTEAEYVNE